MDGDEFGQRFSIEEQQHRAHSRYSVDEECTLLLVSHGLPMRARILDLSLEGCCLRTSCPFTGKTGRPVEISFKVKGFAFRFGGVIRWTDGRCTVGIHFENMIPRRKEELIVVIEEIAAAAGKEAADPHIAAHEAACPVPPELQAAEALSAPRENKAAEPPVFEKAIDSLVQNQVAEAAPAKTKAPQEQPVKAPDRRAQARHEVDTSATIFLVRGGLALRGRILDLSLGGCRIRTNEKFPVGIYTRVEIEFHLQGLPFRLGGVIQAIHNRETVGIRWLDLSERKRQQVQDLIDEIEPARAKAHEKESAPHDRDIA